MIKFLFISYDYAYSASIFTKFTWKFAALRQFRVKIGSNQALFLKKTINRSRFLEKDNPLEQALVPKMTIRWSHPPVVHIMEVPPLDKKLVHTLIFAKVYSSTESRWSLNDSRSTYCCWWLMRRFRFIKTFRF